MAKNKVGVHGTDAERKGGQGGTTAEQGGARTKATCPITLDQFRENAKPMQATLRYAGQDKVSVGPPKEFSTGSLGWYIQDKVVVEIDGIPVTCQVGVNITIVGSKEMVNGQA